MSIHVASLCSIDNVTSADAVPFFISEYRDSHRGWEAMRLLPGRAKDGQLTGIEERTPTGVALLEPDLGLLGVDQSIHPTVDITRDKHIQ